MSKLYEQIRIIEESWDAMRVRIVGLEQANAGLLQRIATKEATIATMHRTITSLEVDNIKLLGDERAKHLRAIRFLEKALEEIKGMK